MKPRFIVCCLLIGFAPLVRFIGDYAQGFFGGHLVILLLPLAFYLFGVAPISLMAAIFIIAKEAFEGVLKFRNLFLLGTSVVTSALLFFFLPSPPSSFLMGFTTGMQRKVTPQEMEQIASAVQQVIPEGKVVWNLDRWQQASEDNAALWKSLCEAIDVSRLPPRYTISHRDGVVYISWGGALTGHYGYRYSRTSLAKQDRDYCFRQLSDKLALVYTD